MEELLSPCHLLKLRMEFLPGGLGCNSMIADHLPSFSFPVCISYLGRFYQDLKDRDVTFSPASIEKELTKFCREARGKENRLVSSWPWPVLNLSFHKPFSKRPCPPACSGHLFCQGTKIRLKCFLYSAVVMLSS